jgi:hypothetical protein
MRLIQVYGERPGRTLCMDKLHGELAWLDPACDTRFARSIADELMSRGNPVFCVWSGKRLDQRSLDIDHCFPWVVWPCGDLWNLLPSSRQVNQRLKRDRLVDVATLASARDRITDWWARGYARSPSPPVADRFVREAVATLSVERVDDEERLFEIFAGVEWQRMRRRNDQRLEEWSGLGLAGA